MKYFLLILLLPPYITTIAQKIKKQKKDKVIKGFYGYNCYNEYVGKVRMITDSMIVFWIGLQGNTKAGNNKGRSKPVCII